MTVTIGVDVGTQGTKAGIYGDEGEVIAEGYAEHAFDYPHPGWVEIDPDLLTRAVVTAVRAAVDRAGAKGVPASSVIGIAFSGVLCAPVFVDADLVPVRPIIPFLDVRAADEARIVSRDIEPLWEEESGVATVDAYATPVLLRWVKKHEPDVYARIAKVLSFPGYIAARLADLPAESAWVDPSLLSAWILGWEAEAVRFSPRQFDAFGLPIEFGPKVVATTDVVGAVSSRWADELGVPAGVPIAAGAGDIPQSTLSAGVVRPGTVSDVAGTASLITVGVDAKIDALTRAPGLLYSLASLPGQSFYWGYVRAGGASLRWYRDQVRELPDDEGFYPRLDERAAQVPPGSDGVLFYPYLSGGSPELPHAAGTWLGLSAGTGTGQLWRSLLESIAFEYADFLEIFRAGGVEVNEVIAVGGGARSALWNQIKADVIGAPWRVPVRQDGGVLANAALARVAVGGSQSDLAGLVSAWVGRTEEHAPRADATARYRDVLDARRKLLAGPLPGAFALQGAL